MLHTITHIFQNITGPWDDSGDQSPAFHRGSPCSIPGYSLWDLWALEQVSLRAIQFLSVGNNALFLHTHSFIHLPPTVGGGGHAVAQLVEAMR